MFEFAYDSINPKHKGSFVKRFWELAQNSDRIDIAVGYIDAGSVATLSEFLNANEGFELNLLAGMQYLENTFSRPQIEALHNLQKVMDRTGKGSVRISTHFRFHGKIYLFQKNKEVFTAYVGSGNLSSITRGRGAAFEAGVLLQEDLSPIETYLMTEVFRASTPLKEVELVPGIQPPSPLEDMADVEEGNSALATSLLNGAEPKYSFEIPLKASERQQKSNLNTCFGKGRENSKTKIIAPRPWYEVELVVPLKMRKQEGFPRRDEVIEVITDDGFKFKCENNGGDPEGKENYIYGKNFRSENNLSVLGAFLKGRLEAYGVLKPGDPVTEETLKSYGRDTLGLKYFEQADQWVLDFRVDE